MSHAGLSAVNDANSCWEEWAPRLEALKEAAAKNGKYWWNVLVGACSGAAAAVHEVLTSDPGRFENFHENPKYGVEGRASDAGPTMKLTQMPQLPEGAQRYCDGCKLQMVRGWSRICAELAQSTTVHAILVGTRAPHEATGAMWHAILRLRRCCAHGA